jgi:thymidylate synthase
MAALHFHGSGADEAWRQAASALIDKGKGEQASRQGPTRELLHATFEIEDPRQRWVISRHPALNPAFAIAETFWILSGRNDASFVNWWNPLLPRFAGSEATYHGAYGFRLRTRFGIDQLERAYAALKTRPETRQVVLQIWDAASDMPAEDGTAVAADIPCNICSILKVRDEKLEWMQIMRSNDLFRGTPHNFVQFTTLQEIMAGWLGLSLGKYCHLSDSLHLYEDDMTEFSLQTAETVLHNRDNLALNKTESDRVVKTCTDCLAGMASPKMRQTDFRSVHAAQVPTGYKNMLLIAAADAARRRDWNDEMHEAAEGCTNEILKVLWENWLQRRDNR